MLFFQELEILNTPDKRRIPIIPDIPEPTIPEIPKPTIPNFPNCKSEEECKSSCTFAEKTVNTPLYMSTIEIQGSFERAKLTLNMPLVL